MNIIENTLDLLFDLVAFKTVYPDTKSFRDCFTYIRNFFTGTNLHIQEFSCNGEQSMVIATHDTKFFDIIFCGHIDVVEAPDRLFTMQKDGEILRGRGVSDMKGQVAVMMEILRRAPTLTDKKIALFLTSDEERGGFYGTKHLLFDQDYTAHVAIVPDGGFYYNLVIESKGVLQLKITTFGTGSHSSLVWEGNNAIAKLLNIYDAIITKYPLPRAHHDWRSSFNLAKIEGGDSLNKVPDTASLYLDIRHTHTDSMESILGYIQTLDQTAATEILATGDPFYAQDSNYCIHSYIQICESILGRPIMREKCHSSSDGRFFVSKNIPCIMMNPVGGNIHHVDEWVDQQSLSTLATIYANYIENFSTTYL